MQIAEEKVTGNTTWKQTFTIDRYGNRRFDAANTTTLGSCTEAICNPTISTSNNRISASGYEFDANGNVTQDAEGKQLLYDAENHQTEVKDNLNNTIGEYLYDGEGKRVKKISNTETTIFVYNASGQLVAEYSTQISQTPQVSYLTQDHLGSPRVITNENGAVTSRKDFTAFGEQNFTAQRTETLGYEPDTIRKGYTGYEKDDESGLDFAQARYYNSSHGRFTSVDPLTASASITNPQTFNRYSYVLNSPYKYTDPLGLLPVGWSDSNGFCSAENSSCSNEPNQWNEIEVIWPEEETDEGVAENHEAMHGEQQQAQQADPPPTPTAEQNAETPDGSPSSPLAGRQGVPTAEALEKGIFDGINKARSELEKQDGKSLDPLVLNEKLRDYARQRAGEVEEELSHDKFNSDHYKELRKRGITSFTLTGEILLSLTTPAHGRKLDELVKAGINAWKGSTTGHWEVITDRRYEELAVGVTYNAKSKTYKVVGLFYLRGE